MTDVLREVILPKFDRAQPSARGFMVRCPVPGHEDNEASLSIGYGDVQDVVMFCQAGCSTTDVLTALDLTKKDICKTRDPHLVDNSNKDDNWIVCGWKPDKPYDRSHRKVADYIYRDAGGRLVFGVARCALKGNGCQGFRQWRPDPDKPGKRKWNRTLPDGTKVGEGLIYRLPEILATTGINYVCVVEGEKDADRIWSLGIPATTCPQGGSKGKSKWTTQHSEWLAGRDVIIIADRDDTGWAHAESVTNSLLDIAQSIEVYRALTGKDVSDHLDAGHRFEDLVAVAVPKPEPENQLVGAA